MTKKGDVKKVNLYANYLLMLSIISALFGYSTRAKTGSIQSIIFLIFFGGFFLVIGYIAIKHRVISNFISMPVENQPKRKVNTCIGCLFIAIGFLLLYAITKVMI